jgi:hypothetical protein
VWLKYKEDNPKAKLSQYCKDLKMPYETTRRAFKDREKKGLVLAHKQARKRKKKSVKPTGKTPKTNKTSPKRKKYSWVELKAGFLSGEYESIRYFAGAHGISCDNGYFLRKTIDWYEKRAKLRLAEVAARRKDLNAMKVKEGEAIALDVIHRI